MTALNKQVLLSTDKHANQHRLSRLTMEVHSDELRIIASAVESYTDELIAALEAAEKRIAELEAREVQLPTRYDLRYGHPINADKRHVMIPKENGSWLCLIDLEHALRVAGIHIKGEEHGNKTRR